jgi:ABC-type multidrug transport system fused ATPase/permease subunit
MADETNFEKFSKVAHFITPYKSRLILLLCLTATMTTLGMVPPLVMKYIIDDIIVGGNWDVLEVLLAITIVLPIIAAGLRIAASFTNAYIGWGITTHMRKFTYGHMLKLPMRFYDEMGTGKIMSRIMSDVASVRSMVTSRMLGIVIDAISFWVALALCMSLNWKMGCMLFLLMPLYFFNYYGWRNPIKDSIRVWRKKMDQVSVGLQERLSGVQLVKAYGRERKEHRAFAEETHESLDAAMLSATHRAGYAAGMWGVSGLRNTVIFCLGCYYVIEGEMTYGGVMAFFSYSQRMFSPILNLSQIAIRFQSVMISVERVLEILEFPVEIKDKEDAVELPPIKGHIVFGNVHFEYKKGEPVLKGINLEVKPGQTVALVGHTGCGKTTLTSLLMRFYDVKEGSISIDGHDLRDVQLRTLRTQIGQVLQDSVMFNMTIRENLLYGQPNASEAEIIEAARIAEIHEFIMRTPEGYDSMLGDDGIKLSVGEKQRLAIARAVLTDPAVLVLDEATSSLDSLSESAIQKAMANVLKGRTSFAIAHRLSTIVNSDLIVVMEHGEIMETGTHEELVRIPEGKYRQLYEQQAAGTIEEAVEAAAD